MKRLHINQISRNVKALSLRLPLLSLTAISVLFLHVSTASGVTPCAEATAATLAEPELIFPLDYVQSAYMSADCQTAGTDNQGLVVLDQRSKTDKETATNLLTAPIPGTNEPLFSGGEILITNLDSDAGRADLREYGDVLSSTSNNTLRPILGYYSPPRLPDFFFPADLNAQPASWRAQALSSDGSLWQRLPSAPSANDSRIQSSGTVIDITNQAAVNALLLALGQVMDDECADDSCIGPMQGFVAFNEWKLTPTYRPFDETHTYDEDLLPNGRGLVDCTNLTNNECRRIVYLPLDGGHPLDLMVDNDPKFGFLVPPKRSIPLFSQSAAQSYSAYVEAREGRQSPFRFLPADRAEFNAPCSQLASDPPAWFDPANCIEPQLPMWARFVDLSETEHWQLWKDWVFETWTSYFIRIAEEIQSVQASNPAFLGNLHFVPPYWGAIREHANEPISYEYFNCQPSCTATCEPTCYDCSNGQITQGQVTLGALSYYEDFNPVTSGNDLDRILQNDAFAGLIHETTLSLIHPVPLCLQGQPSEDWLSTDNEKFSVAEIAKGALLRRIAHENNKLFGNFARSQSVARLQNGSVLSEQQFKDSWDRTVGLLNPDIISTISPRFFTDHGPGTGTLNGAWAQKITEARQGFTAPTLQLRRGATILTNNGIDTLPATPADQPITVTYDLRNLVSGPILYPSQSPGTLTIRNVSITSPNFTIVQAPPLWLTPGHAAPITIEFAADANHPDSGVLSFETNGSGTSTFMLTLQGEISTSTGQTPFGGTPVNIPAGLVEAENFDVGTSGEAYFDTTPGNINGHYRNDADIDIYRSAGAYGVGWAVAGEWMEYTVNVTVANTYELSLRVASAALGAKSFSFLVDDVEVIPETDVPLTGAWGTFVDLVPPHSFQLSPGEHVLRVQMEDGRFNLDSFRLIPASTPPQEPFGGVPLDVPINRIEAENFDTGLSGHAFFDNTPGNIHGHYRTDADVDIYKSGGDFGVGWAQSSEWMEYTVNVTATGTYELDLRVASAASGGRTFSFKVDDVEVLSGITVPNTGAWGQFVDFRAPGTFSLSAGTHELRIEMDSGNFNLDSFRLVP